MQVGERPVYKTAQRTMASYMPSFMSKNLSTGAEAAYGQPFALQKLLLKCGPPMLRRRFYVYVIDVARVCAGCLTRVRAH